MIITKKKKKKKNDYNIIVTNNTNNQHDIRKVGSLNTPILTMTYERLVH